MGILETINAGALGLGSGAVLLLGAAIAVTGTVVGRQPPPKLDLQPGERVLFQSHPSMKPALALIVAGILFFLARIFLMAPAGGGWPAIRYAPLALGVILCSWGIWRYWITHCTAYYATNRRVVRMYRLPGGNSLGHLMGDVNSDAPSFGFIQRLTNRGNLRFTTGGAGEGQVLVFKDIDSPDEAHRIVESVKQSTRSGRSGI